MTYAEQAARAPALTALWNRYDRQVELYREALRGELRAEGNRELLYCDGGMLLLAKSRDAADLALGLAAIRKCTLAEIEHTPYFYALHRLAMRGHDVFELQLAILSRPRYSAYITPHAMSLGQDYAFLYPFLVQEESTYVPRLIARLAAEADPTAQRSRSCSRSTMPRPRLRSSCCAPPSPTNAYRRSRETRRASRWCTSTS